MSNCLIIRLGTKEPLFEGEIIERQSWGVILRVRVMRDDRRIVIKIMVAWLLFWGIFFLPVSFILGSDLETSITSLTLRSGETVIYTDGFFELLDMGEYVLVPLESLAGHLGLALIYQAEQGILTVKRMASNQSVQVDLKNRTYPDRPEWSKEAPIELAGKFFVTPRLIEELTGMGVTWDGKLQELTISGDFAAKTAPAIPAISPTVGAEAEIVAPSLVHGPDFAVDALSYKLACEGRAGENGAELAASFKLNVQGRARDWHLSLGLAMPVSLAFAASPLTHTGAAPLSKPVLSEIQAKYNVDNHLLILGDTTVDFGQFVGKKSLRGFSYTYPEKTFSPAVAYTTLKGETASGNKVTLYVNQLKRETVTATDDEYTFTHVPLIIARLNQIRIVIEDGQGESRVIEQEIAGSPAILPPGTRYVSLAGGWYGEVDSLIRKGILVGMDTDWSLSETTSLHWQAVGRTLSRDGKESAVYGSNLSLAMRLDNAATLSLSWLAGGEKQGLATGLSADLLYALPKGYVKAGAFYVPEGVSRGVKVSTGQGLSVDGVWDVSNRWVVTGMGWRVQPIAKEGEFADTTGVKATVSGKLGDKWQNILAINGDYERALLLEGENRVFTKASVELKHTLEEKYFSSKGNVKITMAKVQEESSAEQHVLLENPLAEQTESPNANFTRQLAGITSQELKSSFDRRTGIELEECFSVQYSKQLMGALTGNMEANWVNGHFIDGSLSLEGETRWAHDNLWLALGGKVSRVKSQVMDSARLEKIAGELSVEKYLNNNNCLDFNLGYTFEQSTGTTSLKSGIKGSHFWASDRGKLTWNLEYVSPTGSRPTAQWPFKLELTRQLPADLELQVKFEQSYGTLLEPDAEQVLTISLAHTLGFAEGVVQGQKYAGGAQSSFVGGIVYLDQNGNGQMDEGEKTLPQIKMALDGRRVVTDDAGRFRFDYVEPGTYKLGFDLKSLNADYLPVTDERMVRVREGENLFLYFGVTMGGSVSGLIFMDKNANGTLDRGEEPLRLIGVELDGGKKVTYTNKDWTFYFENLPLGEHTLRIMLDTLPTETAVTRGNEYSFLITEETLDIRECTYAVAFKFDVF